MTSEDLSQSTFISDLSEQGRDPLLSTTENDQALNFKRHQLTVKDMAEESGLMETNATTESKKQLVRKQREKEERATRDVLYLIEQARQIAEDLRNLVDMKLEELDNKILEAKETLEILEEEAVVVTEAIENFERTGEFDLNEDGTFKNEVLENAIKEWEEKYGPIDRDNYALMNHILEAKLDDYKEQIDTTNTNIDRWERERRYYQDVDQKLEEAQAKLNSDDPELQREGADEIMALDESVKENLSLHEAVEAKSLENPESLDTELAPQAQVITSPKF